MTQSNLNPTADTELGYGQLFAILVRRGVWFLGALTGALAVAAVFSLLEEPTYRSSMQLIVEPNYREQLRQADLEGVRLSDTQNDTEYATQLNLMRSDQFIQEAVELLQTEYPDLTVADVEEALSLFRVKEDKTQTRIFEAIYTGNDPQKTKRILEALKEVYLAYNLEQQEMRLTRGLTFINGQLQNARQNLRESQNALEQFRQQQTVINPQQQAEAVTDALNQIRQERLAAQAQYQEAQAQYTTLQQQLNRSPQSALVASRLSQSSRFQSLLDQLQQTELELAEQRVIFADQDPSVQALLDQRQNQLSLLRQEVGRVLGESAAAVPSDGEALLRVGQLGDVEVALVSKLAEAQASLASIEARLQSLAKAEQALRSEINRFPSLIAEYDRLQPEVEIERSVLQQLLEEREQLSSELARGGYNWQVVEAPQLGRKIGPNPIKNMLLGAVAGLFLGGAVAFMREAMDGVVHTSEELKKQTALPLLGMVPERQTTEAMRLTPALFQRSRFIPTSPALEMVHWAPFRESLDLIYKNIQLSHPGFHLKSLVVTSALPGEGKTTLTLGLALSAARLGQRVLVIDANLRYPTFHEQLNLPNEEGLTTLLEDNRAMPRPVQLAWANSTIDIIPAGPKPVDPVKLLSSDRMKQIMALFESMYDLVLLDTSSIIGTVDTLQTASHSSGTLLVARLDRVTQTELTEAIATLGRLNVLGIIANGSRSYPAQYLTPTESNGHHVPLEVN